MDPEQRLRQETVGLVCLAAAGLALAGLYAGDATGLVGGFLHRVLRTMLGQAAPLAPLLVAVYGLRALRGLGGGRRWLLGGLLALLVVAAWLHLPLPPATAVASGLRGFGGGLVGGVLSWLIVQGFGPLGHRVVLVAGGLVAVSLLAGRSVVALAAAAARRGAAALASAFRAVVEFVTVEEDGPEPVPGPPEPERVPPRGVGDGEPTVAAPPAEDPGTPPPPRPEPVATPTARPAGERRQAGAEGGGPMPAAAAAAAGAEGGPYPYRLPPVSLLPRGRSGRVRGQRELEQQAQELQETLASFGVQARVVGVQQGPAVTRFELEPAAGVKVSRIQGLASDIALRMAVPGVRIEAPIPGKRAVGIEVPNREVAPVYLRDVLETDAFRQSPSPLTVALGMDIAGQPVVASLERLLHLLIAGATGSGKSVCINALLTSLLFKARPDEVRLVLVDPKMVELSAYNGIPHLLAPVVTDPKRAAAVLKWLVREMERRYERFAQVGARDVQRYNAMARERGEETLPLIVVVIDELADLMMVAPVDVEDAIQRLAQMARAAGIHLVVATQRPSVDVITGVIKANIPSRIAFAVSSQTDSRVILDLPGAERLLGRGDMLFYPLGASKPVRVQGAYIGERELEAVLAFVRAQGRPEYREDVLELDGHGGPEEGEDDPLLPEALRIVAETGQASVSLLQRRLRIGYTRAGRLIDMMEARGFVGPHQGSKPRDVHITPEEWRRLFGER